MGGLKDIGKNYATWKKVTWRYGRVFLAAFLSVISIDVLLFGSANAVETMAKAGVIAGVSSLFKYLRESVGPDYDRVVHKLPL